MNTKEFKKGISVVIPCLNEAQTIAQAVRNAFVGIGKTNLSGEVIVADNGSLDGSQKIAVANGARVVPVENKGYGAAVGGGIRAAEYEYVVFADADLSYPFQDLNVLIEPLEKNQADFVLGTRLGGTIEHGAMPFLNRYLGTPVLTVLIRLIYGLDISDCNSGMRAFRTRLYHRLDLQCPGMEYASEMLIRVAQHKINYLERPIRFSRDQRGRAPHLRRWRDGWRHLRFIVGEASSRRVVIAPALLAILVESLVMLPSMGKAAQAGEGLNMTLVIFSALITAPLFGFSLVSASIKADFAKRNRRR